MNTETTQTNAVRWERKPVCCSKKFLQCLQSWWGEAWTKKSTKNRTEETHIGLNLTGTLKHENAHTCARTMDSACVSQDGMAVGRHGEAGRQRVSNTAWCLSWYEGGHTHIHTPWECARKKVNNTDGDPNNEDVSAVMVSVMMRRGSWDDNSGNGNDGERRTQAGVGPSPGAGSPNLSGCGVTWAGQRSQGGGVGGQGVCGGGAGWVLGRRRCRR